ncbi:MAG: DUF327 family protein [Brevinematia bacterium]
MRVSRLGRNSNLPPQRSTPISERQSLFPRILESSSKRIINEEIDETIKELSELDKTIETSFREEHIEKYRELLKKLILRTQEIVKVIEKTSSKNKDRVLKVVVISDEKLKRMLEETITSEVSKLRLKGIIKELQGILISLKV